MKYRPKDGERMALFGGAFNPPHLGHVAICDWLLRQRLADRILAIPCYEHPFGKELAPFEDRLAMTTRAFEGFGAKVEISDVERCLGGVSYTIRTVEYLIEHLPKVRFSIVIGGDIDAEKNKWKDFARLEKLVGIITIPRGGKSPIPDVSATDVRARIKRGQSLEGLVPRSVEDYITAHRLYLK